MKKNKILVFFVLLLLTHAVYAQEAYNWKTLSSKKAVNDAVQVGSTIWAATSGGAFSYNLNTGTYFTLSRTDGLRGVILQAVAVDKYGKIWFGSQDGVIDVYNPVSKQTQSIYDIYNFKEQNGINSFLVKGDSVFVSTDFGVALYQASTLKSIDSYLKFGSFESKVPVKSCFFDGTLLYVATSQGAAIQKSGSTNLASADSWNVFTADSGLPSSSCNYFAQYKNSIIVATSGGLSQWDGKVWNNFLDSLLFKSITHISTINDSLFILKNIPSTSQTVAASGELWLYNQNQLQKLFDLPQLAPTKIIEAGTGTIITSLQGLDNIVNGKQVFYAPNGPYSNLFNNLSVDIYGNLWSSSGKNGAGKGTYFYNGSQWHNFNPWQSPVLSNNDIYNVTSLSDGHTYLSTWGTGFFTIDTNGNNVAYNTKNTPMVGIPGGLSFLVIADIKMDSQGNRWILNYWSANKKTLFCLTKDSTWYAFPNYADSSLGEQYMHLLIDQYDTKWFTYQGEGNKGLYFLNENGTLGNISDDKYGYFSSLSDLNGKVVNCLALDKTGQLWIGTTNGVYILDDPSEVLTQSLSNITVSNVYSLQPVNISCMAVDALNRKWIGSDQGLLLLSSDGTSVIATYNSTNSLLLSNNVLSIAVDDAHGMIYVGLDIGLMAFSTSAVQPNTDFSVLRVYPNPFIASGSSNGLTIDGLIKDSEVKILDITGRVVKTLTTPGGRTVKWDGRTDANALLNSGVYIVVAYDKDGNSVGLQKFAVIRK